jgi:EAL domain-containing protein (putative c-di-GMP-specific phosphodiesterase class I)
MDEPFDVSGELIPLTMSAGLACSPGDGVETRTLLRAADAALNVAKARGGRTGGWWELAGPEAVATADGPAAAVEPSGGEPAQADPSGGSVALCKERLFGGGLEMFMQPAVDFDSGGVYLFESLARLRLGDGSLVAPAVFLQHLSAAETARLFRMGLDQALAFLAAWDGRGLSARLSVNIAPSTLLDPGCPPFVEGALWRHSIAPRRLVLELLETETADWDLLRGPLDRLVALGVGLAMDDLGAGYSSLKRLSMLPFTAVKIDRDMLTGLRTSPLETLSLIATLVQIGRDFDLRVVAEGLEDLGMTEAVAVLGARYGQGYHLARPMPAAEVPAWTADFASRACVREVRTALGALAFHWKFLRLGSPHPHAVEDCPFTGYLNSRGGRQDDVHRWHTQQHRADSSSGASRMIVDWLVREIRSGA